MSSSKSGEVPVQFSNPLILASILILETLEAQYKNILIYIFISENVWSRQAKPSVKSCTLFPPEVKLDETKN